MTEELRHQRPTPDDMHLDKIRTRMPDQQLHSLALAIDDSTRELGFERGNVWRIRRADTSRDPWEGVATWERYTQVAADRLTMDGISLTANGLVSVSVHGSFRSLDLQVSEEQPAGPVASAIGRYIEAMDSLHGTT